MASVGFPVPPLLQKKNYLQKSRLRALLDYTAQTTLLNIYYTNMKKQSNNGMLLST